MRLFRVCFVGSFVRSFVRAFCRSFVSFVSLDRFGRSSVRSFRSFVRAFVRSFVSFVSFVRSFVCLFTFLMLLPCTP